MDYIGNEMNNKKEAALKLRVCYGAFLSYPYVRCVWVEELANDVCGSSNAKDDGAQDLFPPWQK